MGIPAIRATRLTERGGSEAKPSLPPLRPSPSTHTDGFLPAGTAGPPSTVPPVFGQPGLSRAAYGAESPLKVATIRTDDELGADKRLRTADGRLAVAVEAFMGEPAELTRIVEMMSERAQNGDSHATGLSHGEALAFLLNGWIFQNGRPVAATDAGQAALATHRASVEQQLKQTIDDLKTQYNANLLSDHSREILKLTYHIGDTLMMVSTPLRAGESLQDWIHRYGEKLAAVERIFTYSNSAYYLTPAHNAWTPFPLGEVIDQIMEQMPK